MRTMAVTAWIYLLTALLFLRCNVAHSHRGETDTYHVSAGYLFLLRCLNYANVTWSRAGTQNQTLPNGVEVRDGLLWFLPVQAAHNGTYTCEKRGETGLSKITFRVSVSTGDYPDPSENTSLEEGIGGGLPCKQTEILRLSSTRNIQWMKDHHPVTPTSVSEDGFMRLLNVSKEDAGKYTCLVHISLDGKRYTAARSIQLSTDPGSYIKAPILMYPLAEVITVEVGMKLELECLAYIGTRMNDETFMYWIIDEDFVDDYEELHESSSYYYDDGKAIGRSILSISHVRRQFLNVSFNCNVCNPIGENFGWVILQEADHSALYISVALCLTASLATMALAAASLCFKVDMVLAYRRLMRIFSTQASDGKLYDAYVSFFHHDTLSSVEAASFALQLLPEELERKHGYILFIGGRDDCPGEAMHDVISATLHQCRRLIIILSQAESLSNSSKSSNPDGKEVETSPLHDKQNHLCYEQKIGIYDALTRNEPRVILVEIGGPVDYSQLPESLHYIKRKQGTLKWKKPCPETHKPHSNRNFWKNLQYHMPSVPAGRGRTIV